MQKILKKNITQRLLFKQWEKKRLLLKIIKKSQFLPNKIRWKTKSYYFDFPQQSSLSQIKNRCIITGRTRGIYRKFKLSRLRLRFLISKSNLTGFSKTNW